NLGVAPAAGPGAVHQNERGHYLPSARTRLASPALCLGDNALGVSMSTQRTIVKISTTAFRNEREVHDAASFWDEAACGLAEIAAWGNAPPQAAAEPDAGSRTSACARCCCCTRSWKRTMLRAVAVLNFLKRSKLRVMSSGVSLRSAAYIVSISRVVVHEQPAALANRISMSSPSSISARSTSATGKRPSRASATTVFSNSCARAGACTLASETALTRNRVRASRSAVA